MKVNYDMETMVASGGFKQGHLMIISAGRGAGKTIFSQTLDTSPNRPKFLISDQAQVDGETWYSVRCSEEVGTWLRSQHKELQRESQDQRWATCYFDIHEKLYTVLALRWSCHD